MAIRIITDSTCDIRPSELKELNVTALPLKVSFGSKTYADGVDIVGKDFYKLLRESDVMPVTSQINPHTIESAFSQCVEDGDEAVGIFLSSEVSGTFNSAKIAKENVESDKIHIMNSMQGSGALGIMIREAAKMRDAGCTAAEILAKMEDLKNRIRLLVVVKNVKYMLKGGRISLPKAMISTVLGICPIVTVEGGRVVLFDKARGDSNILGKFKDFLESHPVDKNYPFILLNGDCGEKYEDFKSKIQEMVKNTKIIEDTMGAVIGAHAGPEAYGFTYVVEA